MSADEYTPTTPTVREVFIDGAEGEFIGEDFDRWYAAEKAKWQAEALRDTAGYIRDQIGEDGVDSDFNERFEVGGAPYVDRWLMDRADRIESEDR